MSDSEDPLSPEDVELSEGGETPAHGGAAGVAAGHDFNVSDLASPGVQEVWVEDKQEVWRDLPVQSVTDEHVVVLDGEDERTLLWKDVHPVDASHREDLADLAQMNNMHEAPLLHVLVRRYREDKIYTYTGDVLISINPYKPIPVLYDVPLEAMSRAHAEAAEKGDGRQEESGGILSMPHVYAVADRAFRYMTDYGNAVRQGRSRLQNQSVIISGESGAGKTEASKYVMRYLISASRTLAEAALAHEHKEGDASQQQAVGDAIQSVLLQSNHVLEAFGNAKTVRNDNSSRFGKYIMLQYDDSAQLIGASTEHFLLEKSRLTSVSEGERNYHIFYMLCAGIPSDARAFSLLSGDGPAPGSPIALESVKSSSHARYGSLFMVDVSMAERFRVLSMGSTYTASDDFDDNTEFVTCEDAMHTLGFSDADLSALWELLAVWLHMGNIEFRESESANSTSGLQEHVTVQSPTLGLATIAEVLGVSEADLTEGLREKKTHSGAGPAIIVPLNVQQAEDNIKALTKWIYGRVFHWVIRKVNQSHASIAEAHGIHETTSFIGILDIFGFEIMKQNSFEQLCINFANEMLQQQFNEHVFVLEQQVYEEEGLDWTTIPFRDNQPVIDLISKKPRGLLLMLEEIGMLNRRPDNNALLTTYNNTHSDNECYARPRFGGDEFIVKHFAGEVSYHIANFIEKNNDALQEDMERLMLGSTSVFWQNVLEVNPVPDAPGFIPQGAIMATDHFFPAAARPNSAGSDHGGAVGKRSRGTRHTTAGSGSTTGAGGPSAFASRVTVSLQFRTQLKELVAKLRSTEPHYIKCIKPNNIKAAEAFSNRLVIEQLRYSGVLEVVRIRREAFPSRIRFLEYYTNFAILAWGKDVPTPAALDAEGPAGEAKAREIADIIATESLGEEEFRVGKTKIFLRHDGLDRMRDAVRRFYNVRAARVQALVRARQGRARYVNLRAACILLQKIGRRHNALVSYKTTRAAIFRIQAIWCGKLLAARHRKQRAAAVIVQSYTRRLLAQNRYTTEGRVRRVATFSQALVRGFLARKEFLRRRCAKRMQSVVRGFLARRWYVRERAEFDRAQTVVSRCVRKRQGVAAYRRAYHQVVMAQCGVRAWRARRTHMTLHTQDRLRRERERKKAIVMQSYARMWPVRTQFRVIVASTVKMQSAARMWAGQKNLHQAQAAVTSISRTFRGHAQQRRFAAEMGRAVRVQAMIRRFIQLTRYRQSRRACIRIQQALHRSLLNLRLRKRIIQLHKDAQLGRAATISDHFLQHPEDRFVRNKWDNYKTLLHSAIASREGALLQVLQPTAEDLHLRDRDGNLPVHAAARAVSLNILKRLASIYEHGSTITLRQQQDVYLTALHDMNDESKIAEAKEQLEHDLEVKEEEEEAETHRSESHKSGTGTGAAAAPEEDDEDDDEDTAGSEKMHDSVDENTILKEGWMRKKKVEGERGQRRWIRLTQTTLTYLRKPTDRKVRRVIELSQAMMIKSELMPCAFEIHSPALLDKKNKMGRIFFQAESEQELQQWLVPLRLVSQSKSTVRYSTLTYTNMSRIRHFVNVQNRFGMTPLHLLMCVVPNAADEANLMNRRRISARDVTSVGRAHSTDTADATESSNMVMVADPLGRRIKSAEYPQVALWLLQSGCPVDAKDNNGDTAFHISARRDVQEMVLVLQSKNADGSVRNDANETPLDLFSAEMTEQISNMGHVGSLERKPLLDPPLKLAQCTYLTLNFEKCSMQNTDVLENPFLSVSVFNSLNQLVEDEQDIAGAPIRRSAYLWWSANWHMQTPMENLDKSSVVIIQLKDQKLEEGSNRMGDLELIGWVAYRLDDATLTISTFNLEMNAGDINFDASAENLDSANVFLSGEVVVTKTGRGDAASAFLKSGLVTSPPSAKPSAGGGIRRRWSRK